MEAPDALWEPDQGLLQASSRRCVQMSKTLQALFMEQSLRMEGG